MADKRTSFPVLEDFTTKEGLPWHQVAEGSDVASRNLGPVAGYKDVSSQFKIARVAAETTDNAPAADTLAVMPCKDSLGKIRYIPLNPQDKVPVSFDFGDEYSAHDVVEGVIDTQTLVAKITLTVDKSYEKIEAIGSCNRNCKFQIVQKNDAVQTVLGSFLVGPGQFSFDYVPRNLKITAGSTGTQELILYGTQLQGNPSDMHGYVGTVEVP
jgi:hypothetical protein